MADWLGEGLVRCDGGEPFDRGLALGSQTVDQTQGLTLLVVAGLLTEPRFVDRQVSSVERQDIPSSALLGRSGRPSVGPGGSVRRPATTELFPFAGELEGALADWLGEGLVRCDGGETFARGLALGSQTVDQTQRLTLRSQPLL